MFGVVLVEVVPGDRFPTCGGVYESPNFKTLGQRTCGNTVRSERTSCPMARGPRTIWVDHTVWDRNLVALLFKCHRHSIYVTKIVVNHLFHRWTHRRHQHAVDARTRALDIAQHPLHHPLKLFLQVGLSRSNQWGEHWVWLVNFCSLCQSLWPPIRGWDGWDRICSTRCGIPKRSRRPSPRRRRRPSGTTSTAATSSGPSPSDGPKCGSLVFRFFPRRVSLTDPNCCSWGGKGVYILKKYSIYVKLPTQ